MLQKALAVLRWIVARVAVMMYVSYIPQVMNNLYGVEGTPIQSLITAVNCTLWVACALLKRNHDYLIALANAPSVVFGLITTAAAII